MRRTVYGSRKRVASHSPSPSAARPFKALKTDTSTASTPATEPERPDALTTTPSRFDTTGSDESDGEDDLMGDELDDMQNPDGEDNLDELVLAMESSSMHPTKVSDDQTDSEPSESSSVIETQHASNPSEQDQPEDVAATESDEVIETVEATENTQELTGVPTTEPSTEAADNTLLDEDDQAAQQPTAGEADASFSPDDEEEDEPFTIDPPGGHKLIPVKKRRNAEVGKNAESLLRLECRYLDTGAEKELHFSNIIHSKIDWNNAEQIKKINVWRNSTYNKAGRRVKKIAPWIKEEEDWLEFYLGMCRYRGLKT